MQRETMEGEGEMKRVALRDLFLASPSSTPPHILPQQHDSAVRMEEGVIIEEGEIRGEEGEIIVVSETTMKREHVMEAQRVSNTSTHHSSKVRWMTTLSLAFQSLGVVYGDIGTSPLYVLASTFPDGIDHIDDILGVLSMIYYTILIIPLIKYVCIVLKANDNGNGGAFALYSLLCKHSNMSLMPKPRNQPSEHMESSVKQKVAQWFLLILTILGTSMVIGDGIFTPPMSVISAVSGISSTLGQGAVEGIAIAILTILFFSQKFGTVKVGFAFAPIITIWFILIGAIGLYNLFHYDVGVLRAFNPKYIADYCQRNGKKGWISLGGVFLCISGCEAMFADLGHFSVKAIQISFTFITLPAIMAAYSGQAAYLRKHPGEVSNVFYACIPGPFYWPTFMLAVSALIIASQAIISASFSVVSQALSMGCFPRLKVKHTSTTHEGQVYIPVINYMFLLACIAVTDSFKTSEKLSNAYGVAIVCDMVITTFLVSVIMVIVWKTSLWKVVLFALPFSCIEIVYLSSLMVKFKEGGYLPLVSAIIFSIVMGVWFWAEKESYEFELKNQIPTENLRMLVRELNTNRMPGVGVLYSELTLGIPPAFPHLIAQKPSLHSVVVLLSIKATPVSSVPLEDRYVFQQVEGNEYKIFHCILRHGFSDIIEELTDFESQLILYLKEFIKHSRTCVSSDSIQSLGMVESDGVECEIEFVETAWENGVVFIFGETEITAGPNSSILRKLMIAGYNLLRRNFEHKNQYIPIPPKRLLKVGMTHEL